MDDPERTAGTHEPYAWYRVALALTLVLVLAAVGVSTGLVVYTAWRHQLWDGLFALIFAVLSAKASLSWILWRGDPGRQGPGK